MACPSSPPGLNPGCAGGRALAPAFAGARAATASRPIRPPTPGSSPGFGGLGSRSLTHYPRHPADAHRAAAAAIAKGAALARSKGLPPKTTDAVSSASAEASARRRPRCVSVPREAPFRLLPRSRRWAEVQQQQQLHLATNKKERKSRHEHRDREQNCRA
jgi:hypothetical protein